MKISIIYSAADWSTADVARGYTNGLRALGHDVRVFPFGRWIEFYTGWLGAWKDRPDGDTARQVGTLQLASERAVIDAMRHRADVVLLISGMAFHPDGLVLLREAGYRTALLCTESPYNDAEQQYLADLCDLVTVNDRASLATLRHPNLHYLPAAYDPTVHRPQCVGPEYASDVFFVGTGFSERQQLFESADWRGIDLRLFGYWTTVNEFSPLHRHLTPQTLNNAEAVRWYAGAKVGINLHRDGQGWSANPRVFELAAVGAHQVVDDRRPEVAELLGDAVCQFSSMLDFEGRVRACLSDPEHRRRSAAAALERIQGQTFEARAAELLSWL